MNSSNFNEYSQVAKEAILNATLADAAEYIIRRILYTDTGASNATSIAVALSLATSGATLLTSGFNNPDFARIPTIQGSTTGLAGPIVITGRDILGNLITSTISLIDMSVILGTKAFNTITSVSLPTQATLSGTVNLGVSLKLGLDRTAPDNAVLLGLVDDVRETTAPVITSSTDIAQNVVQFTTLPDGSKDFTLYYIGRDL